MATYYIDPVNGLDTNDGSTWDLAWKTLNMVLDVIVVNGTHIFHLKSGVYYGTLAQPANVDGRGILVKFIGHGTVIFRGTAILPGFSLTGYSATTGPDIFQNINFNDFYVTYCSWGAINYTHALLFDNCTFFTAGAIRKFTNDNYVDQLNSTKYRFLNCTKLSTLLFPSSGGTCTANSSNIVWPSDVASTVLPALHLDGSPLVRKWQCEDSGIPLTPPGIALSPAGSAVGAMNLMPSKTQFASRGNTFEHSTDAEVSRSDLDPETPVSLAPFETNGWIQDTSMTGTVSISDVYGNGMRHNSSADAAAIGPVWDFGASVTLKGVGLSLFEPEVATPGDNEVVDSTPLTTTRTIQYRISNTSFLQTDALPAWVDQDRSTYVNASGRYLQLRLVFTMGGA